jgi:ankyrin repeat protein
MGLALVTFFVRVFMAPILLFYQPWKASKSSPDPVATKDAKRPGGLVWACRTTNLPQVRKMLATGASPNITEETFPHLSPLHLACKLNMEPLAEILLAHPRINVNALDGMGWSPLHYACHHGNMRLIKSLLKAKADVTVGYSTVGSPLVAAICARREPVVDLLCTVWPRTREEHLHALKTPVRLADSNRAQTPSELATALEEFDMEQAIDSLITSIEVDMIAAATTE